MKASFPRTRKQRVEWLLLHRGQPFIAGFEYKTDREVKRIFESEYEDGIQIGSELIDPGGIADELSL